MLDSIFVGEQRIIHLVAASVFDFTIFNLVTLYGDDSDNGLAR